MALKKTAWRLARDLQVRPQGLGLKARLSQTALCKLEGHLASNDFPL